MNSVLRTCGFFIATALLLIACAGIGKPEPKVDYYALEYAAPVRADGREKIPVAIKIRRFQASPVYNTDRIIYRDKNFARNEYFYHRWRTNPADLVAFALKRDLQRSSLFEAVFGWEEYCPCSYEIDGSVDEFLEEDHPGYWEAVLAISITLMKTGESDATQAVVFQKTYQARARSGQKNPEGVAQAMSLAMAAVSKQVIDDVAGALQNRK